MTKPTLQAFIVVGSVALIAAGVGLYIAGVFDRAPDLPPIPDVEVTSTDPAVQEQLRNARSQVEASPYDSLANGRLGVLYELYQYPEIARVCYGRASEISPGDFRWKYYLGRIERALGSPGNAIAALTSALEINDQYVPAIALLGEAYLEEGRVDEAEATFRRALAISSRSCSALLGLGKAIARKGDHAAAIEQYELALRLAPDHAPVHYALGLSHRAAGDTARAQQHLDTAQAGGPANPDVDPLVAAMFEQEVGVDAEYRKAKRRLNARQYDEAITMLRAVIEKSPDHYGALGALGQALSLTNRREEALEAFEKAVALNPTNVDFLRPYALLLYRAKRYEDAEAQLSKVLELGGDHHDDHHVLGAVLMKLQRPTDAIREFELALERKPDHHEARRALAQVLRMEASRAPSDAEALPYLERFTEVQPRDLQGWTILGGTLVKLGDVKGALAAFEHALAINPNLPEVVRRRDELRARIERGEG